MRLAPVPIRYASLFPDKLGDLVRYLIESSLPTHASPQYQSACAYMGMILAGLIQGCDREEAFGAKAPGRRSANSERPRKSAAPPRQPWPR